MVVGKSWKIRVDGGVYCRRVESSRVEVEVEGRGGRIEPSGVGNDVRSTTLLGGESRRGKGWMGTPSEGAHEHCFFSPCGLAFGFIGLAPRNLLCRRLGT
jgi:hypothetical protein